MTQFNPPAKPVFAPRKPRTKREIAVRAAELARANNDAGLAFYYEMKAILPGRAEPRRGIAIPGVRS